MYHRKRLLSQHFLLNRLHIKQLVEESSISKSDIVLDIGVGKGILTQILASKAAQVIAIEVDPHLTSQTIKIHRTRLYKHWRTLNKC